MLNIQISLDHQIELIRRKYRKEIAEIQKARKDRVKLCTAFLKYYDSVRRFRRKGYESLFPVSYLLAKDFEMAWLLVNCVNTRWSSTNLEYHPIRRREMESSTLENKKPFYASPKQVLNFPRERWSTLMKTPFSIDDANYNQTIIDYWCEADSPSKDPYDLSPEARYVDVGDTKQFHISYEGIGRSICLFELLFRQERYAEAAECLFRIQLTLAPGEPPRHLVEGPKIKHLAPLMHMYDCWWQARFAEDPERRRALGWRALFWCVELGIRTTGTDFSGFFKFADACEIIGEFELMGEDQTEFLRHFKRFVMHASVSFYKKMLADPTELIPFAERNLPSYDEFKAMYDERYGKTS